MCECGVKIVQFILFIVNFLFFATGIILIGVGAAGLAQADRYAALFGDENTLQAAAGFALGVGVIILIISFCGCCGAFKKSGCLLKIYFTLVLMALILEFIAGIVALAYKDQVESIVTKNTRQLIREDYVDDPDGDNVVVKTIDKLQMQFECCGVDGPFDWMMSAYHNSTGRMYPPSCCTDDTCSTSYDEGCVDSFVMWVSNNYAAVGGVCIGLLVFEVLAMLFACCLIRADKGDK